MGELFTTLATLRRAAADLRETFSRSIGNADPNLRDTLHRLDAEIWKMERAAADAYKALREPR